MRVYSSDFSALSAGLKYCCDQVTLFFIITDPPEFVGPEVDTSVLEGGNITLVCATTVNGNPTPTISWRDNNRRTVSDGTGISGSTTLSLTITGVTQDQAGNWTCTVVNSPGGTPRTSERQISLTVVGECVCVRVCKCELLIRVFKHG